MKNAAVFLFLVFNLAFSPTMAADRPVSDASVKRLIEVTNSKKMLDGVMLQMDEMMKSSMKQAVAGQSFTPEQETVLVEMQGEMADLLKAELNWDALEPMFIEIYRKTFTQKEVDGMLSFYKSPAGQAVIAKMPLVMQNTMQAMQARMGALMPKIRQLSIDGAVKMKKVSPQQNEG